MEKMMVRTGFSDKNIDIFTLTAVLEGRNIECYSAMRAGYTYLYVNEDDYLKATAVPVFGNAEIFERPKVTVETRYAVCNAVVGFDNRTSGRFALNRMKPIKLTDSYTDYIAAKKKFEETIKTASSNALLLVKVFYDPTLEMFLSGEEIVGGHFNVASAEGE